MWENVHSLYIFIWKYHMTLDMTQCLLFSSKYFTKAKTGNRWSKWGKSFNMLNRGNIHESSLYSLSWIYLKFFNIKMILNYKIHVCSGYYCCVTLHPKINDLNAIILLLYLLFSLGQKFGKGWLGEFWLLKFLIWWWL